MSIDIDELLKPIAGPDPCGEDVSYSDVIDQMREARRADDPTLPQGAWEKALKVPDWRKVIALGQDVLTRRSKDLHCGVLLAEALIATGGIEAAAGAFQLLEGLMDRFWDGLHPRLEDGDPDPRVARLDWFNKYGTQVLRKASLSDGKPPMTIEHWEASREVDNLARTDAKAHQAALEAGRPTGEAFDAAVRESANDFLVSLVAQVNAAQAAFDALKATSDQRLARSAPAFTELADALKSVRQIGTKASKDKGLLDAPPTADASSTPGGGESAAPVAPGPTAGSKEAALRQLGEIAQFFRRTEPHSPVAFLLDRAVAWANMPLDQWLRQVVGDEGVLARIRDRVGIPG